VSDWSWNPPQDSGITVRMQTANGIEFELAEMEAKDGSTDRLALCVHGFPELNFSWRYQIPILSERGWRVWAPNLRGYGASSKPKGVAAYHLDILIADLAALIDESGAKEVMLIAHDWGAVIAWQFAIARARPLAKLVIMNVPHPHIFARELKSWEQRRRSWYALFFQIPWLPEYLFGRNGAAGIGRAIRDMAVDKSAFPPEVLDVYQAAAARPGALTAMINYYRSLVRTGRNNPQGSGMIDVPTLMIWGEEDKALGIGCSQGTEAYCSDFTIHRLPGVSHWVQQEAPEAVNRLMADWLDRQPA
jgi:epoxide hydrolase 4